MTVQSQLTPAPLAHWSIRLGAFAAALVLVAAGLHRLMQFPTPTTINLFRVGFAFAAVAALVGAIAVMQIWSGGRSGAWSACGGIALSLAMFSVPLAYLPAVLYLPAINDISTDMVQPPTFVALAKARGGTPSSVLYPGEKFAARQRAAYPDVAPFVVERSVEETFELVAETVQRLKWKVAAEEPPASNPPKAGIIEASDRTLILGFTDDVILRVAGDAQRARVDMRSASRVGKHDLGQNAQRIRKFYRELQTRIETTVPMSPLERRRAVARQQSGGPILKRPTARHPALVGARRKQQDRAQPDAQRGRAPREKQR